MMIPNKNPRRIENRTDKSAILIVTKSPPKSRKKLFPKKRTLNAFEKASLIAELCITQPPFCPSA